MNTTPRVITDHVCNPVNDKLVISVTDEPGAGGANHRYEITGFNLGKNPSWEEGTEQTPGDDANYPETKGLILFQNGPINENGVNGYTQEVLLAIVIDRLRRFQAGPYACNKNAAALAYVEAALNALKDRTLARMARGVEGTHAK